MVKQMNSFSVIFFFLSGCSSANLYQNKITMIFLFPLQLEEKIQNM